ncbi:MAG: YdcF family protein [Clostridiales bacterium]|nr:YdcF family protein [Clostridiales bacterium]
MKRIFRFLLFAAGLVLLVIFVLPVVEDEFNVGNAVGIIFSLLIILAGVFLDFIPGWIRNICKSRVKRFFTIFISLLLVVCLASFSAALGAVIAYSQTQTDDEETLIVLGCKVNGEKPSTMLRERVNSACQYLKSNENAVAILSGGKVDGEDISEAECMYNLIINMGIDSSRLYIEDESTNIDENIKYSLEIIEENNLSENIAIVSSEFHLKRAVMIAEKCGAESPGRVSAESNHFSTPSYYVRDALAVMAEFVMG